MTVIFGNKQHYIPTGPGLLWTLKYGLWPLLETWLTNLMTVIELLSLLQSHINVANTTRFAFVGMRHQPLHVAINCKYQHICYQDPGITNVSHKAIHCPQCTSQPSIKPLFSLDGSPGCQLRLTYS